jgi:uncharacterized protein YkwD
MISRLARPVFGAVLAAAPPPSDEAYSEARILWLLNEERRIRGLGPVRRHQGADMMAQYSANVQAWYGRLGHNPNLAHDVTENVTASWRHVGENVGCGGDSDHLHAMWMRSAGHQANMMRAGEDTVGIGTVYARGCLWATVVFVDT